MKSLQRLSFPIRCLALWAGFLFISTAALAADESFAISRTIGFSSDQLQVDKIMDYDIIRMVDHNYLNLPGAPMLPSRQLKIAIPDGMKVTSIEIEEINFEDIAGQYNIFPAQLPLEIGNSVDDAEFIAPDPDIYRSASSYPNQIIILDGQSDLAGQSFALVTVCPVQYLPAEKKLTLATNIKFILHGTDGYRCGDYLPENASDQIRTIYEDRLALTVINPEDIFLSSSTGLNKSSTALPSATPFDHVIITSTANASSYQPLADWHTRKGVRDTVITTDFIYANYSGTDNKAKIRNFIIDAHQNWATMYFLIGGENTTIPFAYRTYESESVPSDNYYADYDDDWEPEVYVGRSTAEGSTEVTRFVNKVIEYETNPPELNYALDITLLGMDLTIASDPPYYTLTRGQYLKDSIDINYIPSRFAVTKIYDTDAGNHRDAFLAAINDGQNLLNHNDHANYSVMGTGDRNHGWYISYYDIPYLTNYHKYCNIWSVGCHANRMDIEDAISEHFILDNDTTGAISFTGNTRSGWFYVGDPLSLSSQLDLYCWKGLFNQNLTRLGDILAYSKSATNIDQVWPYSDWTFNLLGEPEMTLWTGLVETFTVTHADEIEALPQSFPVHVEKYGGPVAGALVCLSKGSEIFARTYTDASGDALIDISPASDGFINVTVTKQNFKPYLGETEVIGNLPPICETPSDTVIFQCTTSEVVLPVACYDPDGNLASGPELVRGAGQVIEGNWYYTPSGPDTLEITIRCTDSSGFSCESDFIVIFDINHPPTCAVPPDSSITQIMPPTEISLPVTADDSDGNLNGCAVIDGPGTVSDGFWKYTPVEDEIIDVTIRVTDECGESFDDSFHIAYTAFTCGDADGNNSINILDVTFLITYMYRNGPAPVPPQAGDANGNSAVNILDATYLISYLYKSGPAPVCP
nr:hypothetical protein [candidate division Zixibacteria bacterium]